MSVLWDVCIGTRYADFNARTRHDCGEKSESFGHLILSAFRRIQRERKEFYISLFLFSFIFLIICIYGILCMCRKFNIVNSNEIERARERAKEKS